MTDIDWAALQKEADDVLLPDGDYNFIVTKAEAVTSSTGKPMIKLRLAVTDGPKKDRTVFTQLTLSAENPIALRMWFTQLAMFGLGPDFFTTNPRMEQVAQALVNRGVRATIDRREFGGTDRNNVAKYMPFAPDGPPPPGLVVGPPAAGPTVPVPPSGPPVPAAPAATSTPAVPVPPAASPAPATPGTPPPARPF